MAEADYLTPKAAIAAISSTQSPEFQRFYQSRVKHIVLRKASDFTMHGNGLVQATYDIDAGAAPPNFGGLLQLQLKTDFPEWMVSVQHRSTRRDSTTGFVMEDAIFRLAFTGTS